MFITIKHLKWLVPYPQNQRPYGLASHNFPIQTSTTQLARTFEVQIEKLKDQIVVFNMGESNNHIGKINNIEDQIIEIQTGRTQPFFLNLQHIKTLHQV